MLNLIIDIIGGICVVGLTWCLFRASSPTTPKNGQASQAALDGYLRKITVVTGINSANTMTARQTFLKFMFLFPPD